MLSSLLRTKFYQIIVKYYHRVFFLDIQGGVSQIIFDNNYSMSLDKYELKYKNGKRKENGNDL